MKRTPPPVQCLHLTVVSADGKRWHCVNPSCGQEMVVAVTSRAAWSDMGKRLQGGRRVVADKGPNRQKQLAL